MMRRRLPTHDSGSIVMALLAILTMTGIVTLGLATVVTSHLAARHDVAFESALAGAERGLDEQVAQVKADPTAASFDAVDGTAQSGVTYTATATSPSAGTWTIDASGTATVGGRTVTRRIEATVTLGNLLSTPLFGDTAVSLGTGANPLGSAVDRYDSAVSSAVCSNSGPTQVAMGTPDSRMCTEASPALGAIATNGSLQLRSQDLSNFSDADIFNAPYAGYPNQDATGTCAGDTGVCATVGSRVIERHDKASFPDSTLCAHGIGGGVTAFDGSTALATNVIYSFSDVTLNAAAIANLGNVPGSQLVVCFSGKLTLPSAVPLNATIGSTSSLITDPSQLTGVTNVIPRPPSTLLLISVDTGPTPPVVDFGGGGSSATSVAAVIYAPKAACTSNGHVDVYGLLVCGSVAATSGLDVHYDVQLQNMSFDRAVSVSHWHEL